MVKKKKKTQQCGVILSMTTASCMFWTAAQRGRAQAELSGLVVMRTWKSGVEEVEGAEFAGQ